MPDETIDTNASTLVSEGATAVADAEAASSSVPIVDTNAAAQDQVVESSNNVNAVNPEQTVVEQATPTTTNASNNAINNVNPDQSFEQKIVAMAVNQAHNEALDANAGQSMDNFLTNEYSYNPEEVGSYWVAGGINDTKTQMSFLNAIIQEEMYDTQELGRFSYDTQIAVARAYAAQKKMETAYNYYQIAQQTAISEAALTGFYLPAEARYMLANYEKAQYTLNDPDADEEDYAKARRIASTCERWWNTNGISSRGIKTISMMNYEESVRHNEIMFELEKETAEWQRQYYEAAKAEQAQEVEYQKVQLRGVNLSNQQSEIKYGIDINGDNKYGGSELGVTYDSLTTMLEEMPGLYATLLSNYGSETALKKFLTKNGLGDNYESYKMAYNTYVMGETLLENDYNIKGSDLQSTTYTAKDSDGEKTIAILPLDDGTTAAYEVEGTYSSYSDARTYKRIKDSNYELEDGTKLSDHYTLNTNDTLYYQGNKITITGISGTISPEGETTVEDTTVDAKTADPKDSNTDTNPSKEKTKVVDGNTYTKTDSYYWARKLGDNESEYEIIDANGNVRDDMWTVDGKKVYTYSGNQEVDYDITAIGTNRDTTNFTLQYPNVTDDDVHEADMYDQYGRKIYRDNNGNLYIRLNEKYFGKTGYKALE